MDGPRISVLLPVYNAEATLHEAIASILDQTERQLELVIVDDGSTDRSPEIIERWQQKDKGVQPVFTDHHGIVNALNKGLERVTAPYIARMDADDVSLPERLEKQANYLDRHPETGLVSCLVEHFGDQRSQEGYRRYVNWINTLTTHYKIELNRFIESPLAHPSVMVRRSVLNEHGRYRQGDFPEDYELWLRWLEGGVKMEKIPEVLLKWRDAPDRLSRNHDRYSAEAFYRVKSQYLARWLKRNNPRHPEVVIWGAGRSSRRRAEMLADYNIAITHYIDVDPNKIGQQIHGRPVWSPDEVPRSGEHFILSYVGNWGVNQQISTHLQKFGYDLGIDLIFAA